LHYSHFYVWNGIHAGECSGKVYGCIVAKGIN
jgi:hypothetical protein